jgi:hypothetical protein
MTKRTSRDYAGTLRLFTTATQPGPGHVFAYDDGEIRQEFSICMACTITGGSLSVSGESTDVRFIAPEDIPGIQIHESILIRIRDYLSSQSPVLR